MADAKSGALEALVAHVVLHDLPQHDVLRVLSDHYRRAGPIPVEIFDKAVSDLREIMELRNRRAWAIDEQLFVEPDCDGNVDWVSVWLAPEMLTNDGEEEGL